MSVWHKLLALIGFHSVSASVVAAEPPLEYQLWHAMHVVVVWQQGSAEHSRYIPEQILKGGKEHISRKETPELDVDDSTWRLLGRVPAPGTRAVIFLTPADVTPPGHDITGLYALDEQNNFTYAADDPTVRRTLNITELVEILNQPPFNTRTCSKADRINDYLLCMDENRRGHLYHHGMEVTGKHDGQIITADPPDDTPLFIYRSGNNNSGITGWSRAEN